jgi:hypothetical protein
LPTSLLAYAVLALALKSTAQTLDGPAILSRILHFATLDALDAKLAAKEMLTFTKGFEKQYPNFKNLRIVYNEEFKSLRLILGL